jgi:hypothetical protein
LALLTLLPALSGCQILGVAAHALPPPTIQPKYANLAGQSLGVMIWADRGIRIDWPNVQLDLGNAVQKKLADAAAAADKSGKPKQLKGVTFAYPAASFVRYQKDHPEIEGRPVVDVAPQLGVRRLIYVEIEDFATRSDMSVELFRGSASATVRVIEIDDAGHAKVAFEQNNVRAIFPPKVPREGLPTIGDARTYGGLIDAFSTEITHLFVPYQEEE